MGVSRILRTDAALFSEYSRRVAECQRCYDEYQKEIGSLPGLDAFPDHGVLRNQLEKFNDYLPSIATSRPINEVYFTSLSQALEERSKDVIENIQQTVANRHQNEQQRLARKMQASQAALDSINKRSHPAKHAAAESELNDLKDKQIALDARHASEKEQLHAYTSQLTAANQHYIDGMNAAINRSRFSQRITLGADLSICGDPRKDDKVHYYRMTVSKADLKSEYCKRSGITHRWCKRQFVPSSSENQYLYLLTRKGKGKVDIKYTFDPKTSSISLPAKVYAQLGDMSRNRRSDINKALKGPDAFKKLQGLRHGGDYAKGQLGYVRHGIRGKERYWASAVERNMEMGSTDITLNANMPMDTKLEAMSAILLHGEGKFPLEQAFRELDHYEATNVVSKSLEKKIGNLRKLRSIMVSNYTDRLAAGSSAVAGSPPVREAAAIAESLDFDQVLEAQRVEVNNVLTSGDANVREVRALEKANQYKDPKGTTAEQFLKGFLTTRGVHVGALAHMAGRVLSSEQQNRLKAFGGPAGLPKLQALCQEVATNYQKQFEALQLAAQNQKNALEGMQANLERIKTALRDSVLSKDKRAVLVEQMAIELQYLSELQVQSAQLSHEQAYACKRFNVFKGQVAQLKFDATAMIQQATEAQGLAAAEQVDLAAGIKKAGGELYVQLKKQVEDYDRAGIPLDPAPQAALDQYWAKHGAAAGPASAPPPIVGGGPASI